MQAFLRSSQLLQGHYRIIPKKYLGNYHFAASYHLCFDPKIQRQSQHAQSLLGYIEDKHHQPSLLLLHISSRRFLNISPVRFESEPLKPSSKVEVTVNALQEQKKDEEKKKLQTAEVEQKKPVVRKSLKDKVLDELRHYYHGFRLLFIDIRISYGLSKRVLQGHSLSRREYRLLMRTVGDMFRLVPFSVFIIVPFMEFLLPFFIKFFPGMLPSTFQTATEKEDKLKQSLKVKLEMAKFLQHTLDEMSVQHKDDHYSQQAKEFSEWFARVRTSGAHVTNEEILKFSKLFQDEITLDSLSRSQLVALCRVLEVQTYGTNNLLRFQLRMKLRTLAADDKMIQKEGIDSLSLWEVQQACRARGLRAYGVSEERLRQQLQDWLVLSLDEKVPPSLLLLSMALMLPDTIPTGDKLKATISALPDAIVNQTKYAIGEKEGKIDNKVQLDVILEEAKRVNEERLEMGETLIKVAEKKKEASEVLEDKAKILTDTTGIEESSSPEVAKPVISKTTTTPPKEDVLHTRDVEVLEDALDAISKEKKIMVEKVEIEELKEQLADYTEDVQDLKKVAVKEIRETKAAKRLYNKVNKMINNMDYLLKQLETKEQKLMETSTVTPEKEAEKLRIDEIITAIRKIQKVPDDSKVKQIESVLSKMDDDRDGSIKVEDVLKVIEIIGKENVQLSTKQLDELLELLDKEEILEVEKKIERTLKKELEEKLTETTAASVEKDSKPGYDQALSTLTDQSKMDISPSATSKIVPPPSVKSQETEHGPKKI